MEAKKKSQAEFKKENRIVEPIFSMEEIVANKRDIKYLVVHCSATFPSMKVDRERIKGWHLTRGFVDIGYHLIVARDGSYEKGRDLDGDGLVLEHSGAHVKGYNSSSIAICWIGGITEGVDKDRGKRIGEDNRTEAQKEFLKRAIRELYGVYPKIKTRGHRDFSPDKNKDGVISRDEWMKECPSFDVKAFCTEIGISHN